MVVRASDDDNRILRREALDRAQKALGFIQVLDGLQAYDDLEARVREQPVNAFGLMHMKLDAACCKQSFGVCDSLR